MATPVTRVLIADDHLMRAGLIELLTADPSIEIAGKPSTGQEALDRARRLTPDVVHRRRFRPDRQHNGLLRTELADGEAGKLPPGVLHDLPQVDVQLVDHDAVDCLHLVVTTGQPVPLGPDIGRS